MSQINDAGLLFTCTILISENEIKMTVWKQLNLHKLQINLQHMPEIHSRPQSHVLLGVHFPTTSLVKLQNVISLAKHTCECRSFMWFRCDTKCIQHQWTKPLQFCVCWNTHQVSFSHATMCLYISCAVIGFVQLITIVTTVVVVIIIATHAFNRSL